MKSAKKLISLKVKHPETLLLAIGKDGTMRIGLPPRDPQDDYSHRAAVVGKLGNASHVICSPEGELFCVRDKDLYRGPLQTKEGVDWFSTARRVGRCEWSEYKILFFHPKGELYGTTKSGEFYKGPQPDNENVPWMYGQAEQIGTSGWENCEALFFDPSDVLYAVSKQDNIVKSKPPTSDDFKTWMETVTVAGGKAWLNLTHFMAFGPLGELWCVDKRNGNLYSGSISPNGKYLEIAEKLGSYYNTFPFLSFTKDKTIGRIISFEFLLENAKRSSENPEVIEERVYDNRMSSSMLKHCFTFDKTVKSSSSFSQEHGFTAEIGTVLKFTTGIPCIAEFESKVTINLSTTNVWSFTETNETQVVFSSSSQVDLPAGKAIRVVASVAKAELIVPYRAKIKTLFGFEAEIEGTWNGVSLYNLMVRQEDYNTELQPLK
ncbi:uncharacterized protein [Ranitomeya imitator]|uniref:uncharacterized protein n=1 Tax=Ranitomeya imitator TaxID=111125 RepID=UPI0037E8D60A